MSYFMTIIYSIPIALLFAFGFFHFKKRGHNFVSGMSGLCGLLTVPAAMFYALTPFDRLIGTFLAIAFVFARVLGKKAR